MGSLVFFLVWAAAIFFMMRFGCGAHVMGHGHRHADSRLAGPDVKPNADVRWAPPDKAIDPVCHMSVATANAKTAVYGGHLYHFCSQDCRGKFEANPPSYLTTANSASSANEHHHAS